MPRIILISQVFMIAFLHKIWGSLTSFGMTLS